jgi:nitrogen regulatory protein PII
MKAVFVVFNQAHTERVDFILDLMELRGYTWWNDVKGRGSVDGAPHLGTHTWPEINSAILTVIEDEQVDGLLEKIKKLDEANTDVGVRAFVWPIEKAY